MKVLLDTNIILDVLCRRQPHVESARALWAALESNRVKACVVATTISTVYYLVRKYAGDSDARSAIHNLLSTFDVCPVDNSVLLSALRKPMRDFEDAIIESAAEVAEVTHIVTRNQQDFAASGRTVVDAAAMLSFIEQC